MPEPDPGFECVVVARDGEGGSSRAAGSVTAFPVTANVAVPEVGVSPGLRRSERDAVGPAARPVEGVRTAGSGEGEGSASPQKVFPPALEPVTALTSVSESHVVGHVPGATSTSPGPTVHRERSSRKD